GLPTWDAPAAPCLSSRVVFGLEITPRRLDQVERAEAHLRDLGVTGDLRVRHHGQRARIEVEPHWIPWLEERLDAVARRLGGFGVFPDFAHPRVIWVGITAEPALEILQHRVEQEFEPLGFPTEGRPFRPHLTLGRAGREARPRDFTGLEAALGALQFAETLVIESVDLMQSTLQSGGAVYHVRHSE